MRFHVKYEFDEVDHKKNRISFNSLQNIHLKYFAKNSNRPLVTVAVTVAIAESVVMQYTLLSFNSHAYMPTCLCWSASNTNNTRPTCRHTATRYSCECDLMAAQCTTRKLQTLREKEPCNHGRI